MSAFSTTFAKNKLLDLLFSARAWSGKPSTLHVALFTATPNVAGTGTEVSGTDYARVSVTVGGSAFTVTDNAVTNDAAWTFPVAGGDWGTIVAVGIYDAPSGGNLLFVFPVAAESIVRGMQYQIAAGAFDMTLEGNFTTYAANKLLSHVFIGDAMPTIATHYFALGTGGSVTGVSGEHTIGNNGYARAAVTNNVTTWPAADAGVKLSGAAIAFASSSGAWASSAALPYFAIYDASSGGNALWWGLLDASIVVDTTGLTPSFGAAGDLEITMD